MDKKRQAVVLQLQEQIDQKSSVDCLHYAMSRVHELEMITADGIFAKIDSVCKELIF